MRIKYNNGGGVTAFKKIGDLDVSVNGYGASGGSEYNPNTGEKEYYGKRNAGANARVTAKAGPFTVSHMSGIEKIKHFNDNSKVNYSHSSLGVDTKAGRFGIDSKGNASYNYKTKGGTKISAHGNKRGGNLSIFKELR